MTPADSDIHLAGDASAVTRFRRWFWRPPRPHGEIEAERSVSFLELFYDLVYVVVVAQASHHLADHVSARGFVEFAIVFGLIWIAWMNGSLYYELHGREDGRTRTFVFVQMAILAVLAVFTGEAAGASGTAFALTYAAFLAVMIWLWYTVRRQDRPEFMAVTARYLLAMVVSLAVMLASAFLPDDARLAAWASLLAGWLVVMLVFGWQSRRRAVMGMVPTESMVERFDLFTIIVLGEVVSGVVIGLSDVEPDVLTIGTGVLALIGGFGLWWIVFDVVGRRMPSADGLWLNAWMESHLPVTLAIAASGAATGGLISHAQDAATPAPIAWLLTGSIAICLFGIMVMARSIGDYHRKASVYRPVLWAMGGAVVLTLVVGLWRPAPWLLAGSLIVILSGVWLIAVDRWLRAGADEGRAPVA